MRQLLLIASVVGLFMYVGFVVQEDGASVMAASGMADIRGLQRAFDATGARLEQVVIAGWVQAPDQSSHQRVVEALAWKPDGTPGQSRALSLRRHRDAHFLSLHWVLTGEQVGSWVEAYQRAKGALSLVGTAPAMTVQLEGRASTSDFGRLVETALDEVDAEKRQPWNGPPAASAAGWSHHLPASAFGVNIQVAARFNPVDGESRLWVAWPALIQEY